MEAAMTYASRFSFRLLPLLLPAAIAACAASAPAPNTPCNIGMDCISGVCNEDGTCAPATTSTGTPASTASGSGGHAGQGGGTSTTGGGGMGGEGGSAICTPANDGTITRAEVPLAAGLHATYETAENVMVSTAGMTEPDGSRVWDLSGMLSGDHGQLVETLPMTGQWFASDFAAATYASQLSDTADLLGVFQVTDTSLLLLGVASPTMTGAYTELTYDPPVTTLSFPITSTATWMTTSTVTGIAEGVPVAYAESYSSTVDAYGSMKTPFATFPVQRVDTYLTRNVDGLVTTIRTFAFVTTCFGVVAKMVSQDDETETEFTSVAELSRLTP
jgi:hypothetical protein